MSVPVKHPDAYSEREKHQIEVEAAAIPIRYAGSVVPLEDVRVIVQHLSIKRAAAFNNIKVKPVKEKKKTKAELMAEAVARGEVPPPKPKTITKAAKLTLFFRKSNGEILTEEEEALVATLPTAKEKPKASSEPLPSSLIL